MWFKITVIILLIGVIFMAHGQPDYGMYSLAKTIYHMTDMGELAARLGSICTFDRRGDVVFLDDFESGLGSWQKIAGGTGSDAVISADNARNGFLSCKMTTGSDGTKLIRLARYLPLPVYSAFGVEFSVAISPFAITGYLTGDILVYDGVNVNKFMIKYDLADQNLYMYDSAGAWVDMAMPYELQRYTYLFHTIKLVGDFSTDRWKRVIVDNFTVDLSGYAVYTAASAGNPMMEVNIILHTDDDANRYVYLDDFIITQNEP
ncbi:MAG: hypothetical protein A2Y89_06720 [Chloroflexi bacterium RBG_13_51_18]|nr:MAG: hypothetical protein A2Y89_06720 [Chloroflexi bacterium RBG_13_51_18]